MTCGSFQIINGDHNPLLTILPPLIHIPSGSEQLDESLEPTLKKCWPMKRATYAQVRSRWSLV